MTLHEFLCTLSEEEFVGIWDIDYPIESGRKRKRRWEGQPTQQNYYKVKNIPYGKIRYFLDKDVAIVNHTEKGILIRIYTKGKAKEDLERYDLADKIAKAIKRECF